MQHNSQDTLFELLKIINYPNNRQKFINEFEELNRLEALANILDRLPEDLQQQLQVNHDAYNAFEKYISKEAYVEELIKVSQTALENFVEAMSPHLSLSQKEQAVALVNTPLL